MFTVSGKLMDDAWKSLATKDADEREQSMLHALTGGRTCDEIGGTKREQAFCRKLEPEVRALVERGFTVVPENDRDD